MDRPKWMPSVSRILELAHAGNSPDAWEWECRCTGLRAQIEVLEQLSDRLLGQSTLVTNVLIEEIAALRKELGE